MSESDAKELDIAKVPATLLEQRKRLYILKETGKSPKNCKAKKSHRSTWGASCRLARITLRYHWINSSADHLLRSLRAAAINAAVTVGSALDFSNFSQNSFTANAAFDFAQLSASTRARSARSRSPIKPRAL